MFYLTMSSTHFIYGYMALDIQQGKPLPPHGYSFYPTVRVANIVAFVTPIREHGLEREIAQ